MIKVHNLAKVFGAKRAVDGISFSVERGEVLGFLGPNGAGKSTTMRMITGFIPPTAGKVTVGGFDMVEQSDRSQAPHRLSAGKRAGLHRHDGSRVPEFCGGNPRLARRRQKKGRRIAWWKCAFSKRVLHQSVETLSKGYRHRTCFAQSIIHDPDVLVLDEPTDGLDPNQKHEVRELDPADGRKESDHFFHAHSGGSRRGLFARHHH